MHDRSEWTRGPDGEHRIKGKKYNNLVEFSRPCATCGKRFSIFVTPKIADNVGGADSNSFGLKNCEDHRRNKTAVQPEAAAELIASNETMKQELDGLYQRLNVLAAENARLQARLAQYELQGVMAAAEPVKKFPWGG